MSVFGTGTPYFTSGSDTVNIAKSIIEPNFFRPRKIVHESRLGNGKRTYSRSRDYVDFDIMVLLYKYNDPAAKAAEIVSYEDQLVKLFPFGNGGMNIGCFMVDHQIYPLNSPYSNDIMILSFVSLNYAFSTAYIVQKPDGKYIKTKDGKYIKVKGKI